MKEIKEVTAEGIHYIDEEGNPHFIEFEICYQNFLSLRYKQQDFQFDDESKRLDEKRRSVGYRKFSSNPPYIEFYTVPPTRFEFPSSGRFYELDYRIKKAGWRTIDGD